MHPKILIPPSEGKASGGYGKPRTLTTKEQEAIKRVAQNPKLLGLKDVALDKALFANKQAGNSPTMKAVERYTGVLYDALDYGSLSSKAKKHCGTHVHMLSGLFGLIRADEMIPDYKLKIQAAKHLEKVEIKGDVIDLLPNAHRKYVQHDGVIVHFLKDGKPMAHFGKHIKGKFVRWLVQNPPKTYEDLLKFPECKGVRKGTKLIFNACASSPRQ